MPDFLSPIYWGFFMPRKTILKKIVKLFCQFKKSHYLYIIKGKRKTNAMQNHFINCQSIEDAKKLFKKLAFENHPDRGGNEETMKRINIDYAFIIAKIAKGGNFTESEINDQIKMSEEYQAAVNAIAGLDGLIVELIGDWIWVTGATKPHKDALKAAGFFWASKKLAWYFRAEQFKCKHSKKQDLETIRAKYGSTTVRAQGPGKIQ